ncbi:chemotaxis protein CheB [Nostoc sp. DSM 114160]|jgi:two-component system chemotaxis response regulator CheB
MIEMAENAKNHPPHFTNAAFDIVAIAASAGGLTAIIQVLSTLKAEFPAAIAIVQHLAPEHPSFMAEILSRRTDITVKQAQEGDSLTPRNGLRCSTRSSLVG